MLRTQMITVALTVVVVCAVPTAEAYPPSGYDVISTSAEIRIYDPSDYFLPREELQMTGYVVIWRSDPYDTGDGTMRIDTRMDTLLLRGHSIHFGDSIFITLNRDTVSSGAIIQLTPGIDYPAESYFDVFYVMTFSSEPVPKSGHGGAGFGAVYKGGFDYDPENQTGTMILGDRPLNRPPEDLKEGWSRQAATGADRNPSPAGVSARLSGAGGSIDGIYADRPVNIDIYINNDTPDRIRELTNGFRIYSPEGAHWAVPVVTTALTLCPMFGSICEVAVFGVNGANDDTVGLTAAVDQLPGMPTGWDKMALTIATQVDASEIGNSLCIDSTFFLPSGTWQWTSSADSFLPPWGGPYCWDIIPPPLCEITCPIDGRGENEPCGSDLNGGCDMAEPTFEPIECGETVCGAAWADQGMRDTDWYEFYLLCPVDIQVTATAEFPFVVGFIDTSGCSAAGSVDPFAIGDPCDTVTVTRPAGPGTYWVFIGPSVFDDYPCGLNNNDYWLNLACVDTADCFINETPPHMTDTILAIPPLGQQYFDPRRTPILDAVTGDTVAYVVHEHNPECPDDEFVTDCFESTGQATVTLDVTDTFCVSGFFLNLSSEGRPDTRIEREPGPYVSGETYWTRMVQLWLSGDSPYGQVIVRLRTDITSNGSLENVVATDGIIDSCDSYFNLYLEIELPDSTVLHTDTVPLVMRAEISSLPPGSTNVYLPNPAPAQYIRLYGPFGHWGWLCHAAHIPGTEYPCDEARGACCDEGTGDCRMTTVADCVGPNEQYQGDNSSCLPPPCECCLQPIRGDVGWSNGIDIADLVYFIDHMFNDGPEPPCFMEADLNNDQVIDITDLVWLVEYLFAGGPAPCPCDCSVENCPPGESSKIGMETIRRWSAHIAPVVRPSASRR